MFWRIWLFYLVTDTKYSYSENKSVVHLIKVQELNFTISLIKIKHFHYFPLIYKFFKITEFILKDFNNIIYLYSIFFFFLIIRIVIPIGLPVIKVCNLRKNWFSNLASMFRFAPVSRIRCTDPDVSFYWCSNTSRLHYHDSWLFSRVA